MSKIPCAVIQDLMVLYEDDVISAESRKLVEEHIQECEDCRILYEKTKAPLPDIKIEDEDSLKSANERAVRSIKTLKRKLTSRHLMILGLVLLLLFAADYVWSQCLAPWIYSVPADDVQVTELYELKNGDLYCTLKTKEKFTDVRYDMLQVPSGKENVDYDKGWYELHFGYPQPFEHLGSLYFYQDEISFIFPKEEKSPASYAAQYTHSCASIYYRGKSDDDRLMIWEEGQKVDPAPREIEQKVKEEYKNSQELDWEPFAYPITLEP